MSIAELSSTQANEPAISGIPREIATKMNPLIGTDSPAQTAHNVAQSLLRLAGALCDAKAALMDPPDLWPEFQVLAAALMYEHGRDSVERAAPRQKPSKPTFASPSE